MDGDAWTTIILMLFLLLMIAPEVLLFILIIPLLPFIIIAEGIQNYLQNKGHNNE